LRLFLFLLALLMLSGCIAHEPPVVSLQLDVCSHIQDSQDKSLCESKVRNSWTATPGAGAGGSVPVRTSLPLSGILSWWAIYYAFGFIIARAVFVDARSREWTVLKVRPIWWAAMCVVDPAFGVLVYWVVHYSRLAPRFPGSNNSLERTREE
jgi:hypothetical protein